MLCFGLDILLKLFPHEVIIILFKIYLFILREREQEQAGDGQRKTGGERENPKEACTVSAQPVWGSIPGTVRS